MSNLYKEYIKLFKQYREGRGNNPDISGRILQCEILAIILLFVGVILLTASTGYYDAVFSNKY